MSEGFVPPLRADPLLSLPPSARDTGPSLFPDALGASSRRSPPLYAALDLGTNNCRLLIARPTPDGFAVVDAFSRIIRLGEGVGRTGRLSTAAMDRGVAALTVCADKMVRRGVNLSRAVATEACRRAVNGPEFVDRVYHETGIALDVITTAEEARLAAAGCHMLLEPGSGEALIFDIGGGSTEIVWIDHNHDGGNHEPGIRDWISIPWGVVSLIETEPHDANTPMARREAYARMRARASEAMAPFMKRLTRGTAPLRLLGTSGTVTTLGSLYLDLPHYDRSRVDGLQVPAKALRRLCAQLADTDLPARARMNSIGPERADLVVAGCALLEAILDAWPAPQVGVADRGIREGILRALIARYDHQTAESGR